MKIGMLLDKEFPSDPRVQFEAKAIIAAGHEVVLFCLERKKELIRNEMIHGVSVERCYYSNLNYKLSALVHSFPFYNWLMRGKIEKFLKRHDFDIVHVHDMVISKIVLDILEPSDTPVVLDLHENKPEIMRFYNWTKKFPAKYLVSSKKWKEVEESLVRKADGVVLVTKFAVDEMLLRVPEAKDKMISVANYIDHEVFNSVEIDQEIVGKYHEHFTLLYVGDTSARRGLESVFRAIPNAVRHIPNLKVVILGRSNFDGYLFDIIEELNISSYVDYVGWVDEKIIPIYVEACDVGISPILKNIHHDTTYANKVFQYIAKRKPVLVSDVVAQKDLVDRYQIGEHHKSDDYEDFSKKLIQIYEHRLDPNFYFQKIEDFNKEFSEDATYGPLLDLYAKLQKNKN